MPSAATVADGQRNAPRGARRSTPNAAPLGDGAPSAGAKVGATAAATPPWAVGDAGLIAARRSPVATAPATAPAAASRTSRAAPPAPAVRAAPPAPAVP